MNVMAIAALDEPFVHAMVVGLSKVRLRSYMAAIAETRLCTNEKMFRRFSMVRRVAIHAPDIVARVRRGGEMPLLMFCPVASQASGIRILLRQRREADDLGHIPAAFYVGRSGTVTRLAAMSIVQRSLEMCCALEALVELFMTG